MHKLFLLLCPFLTLFLAACDFILSSTPQRSSITPVPTNIALNTWHKAAPGIELRYEMWKSSRGNEDTVTIARFDLRYIELSVKYQPGDPLSINKWVQQEHATAIINGGYFESNNTASALVVSNGQQSGRSYQNVGGMLSVDTQGHIKLRSLSQQPYSSSTDQLRQATQSFPMLLQPGGQRAQFKANAARDRRTVVAVGEQKFFSYCTL